MKHKSSFSLLTFVPLFCSILGFLYVARGFEPLIWVPSDDTFHFSLITVNALFGGFLYTNYTMMVGLLDSKIIQKLSHTNIIIKRDSHILSGIICSTISVLSSLCLILLPQEENKFFELLRCFILNVELVFMLSGILFFLLSLKEIREIIHTIHNSDGSKTKEEIAALKSKIKNNH